MSEARKRAQALEKGPEVKKTETDPGYKKIDTQAVGSVKSRMFNIEAEKLAREEEQRKLEERKAQNLREAEDRKKKAEKEAKEREELEVSSLGETVAIQCLIIINSLNRPRR